MKMRHVVWVFTVGLVIVSFLPSPIFGALAGETNGESVAAPNIRLYAMMFLAFCCPSLAIGAGFALRRGQRSVGWRLIGSVLLSIAMFWLPFVLAVNTAQGYREATDEMNRTFMGWFMQFWMTYFGVLLIALVLVLPARLMGSAPHAPTAATATAEAPPAPATPTSPLAIASLVCGCLAFPLAGLSAIPGLVLGIMALSSIKTSEGRVIGRDLAWVGICLSAGSVVLFLLFFFLVPAIMVYLVGMFLHYLVPGAAA